MAKTLNIVLYVHLDEKMYMKSSCLFVTLVLLLSTNSSLFQGPFDASTGHIEELPHNYR